MRLGLVPVHVEVPRRCRQLHGRAVHGLGDLDLAAKAGTAGYGTGASSEHGCMPAEGASVLTLMSGQMQGQGGPPPPRPLIRGRHTLFRPG